MRTSETRSTVEEFGRLGGKLKALSSPNRLRLIAQLQEARTIDDIHLTPAGRGDEGSSDRQLSRQGVRHHLQQLEDVDLLCTSTRPNERGRDRREYVVNEPSVYGLLEELRQLLAPGSEQAPGRFETEMATGAETGARSWPEGPKLVLLKGSDDERVFDLGEIDTNPSSGRGWVIGRSSQTQIPLPYDPYLSTQNTEILREKGDYRIVDLRVSTNGTRLNGELLEPGEEAPLTHGDVVKVGCSALVFHER